MLNSSEFAIPEYPDGTPAYELWPNCATPDCGGKACTWATLPKLCARCCKLIVGEADMIRRWNETHDISWDEAKRLEEGEDSQF